MVLLVLSESPLRVAVGVEGVSLHAPARVCEKDKAKEAALEKALCS